MGQNGSSEVAREKCLQDRKALFDPVFCCVFSANKQASVQCQVYSVNENANQKTIIITNGCKTAMSYLVLLSGVSFLQEKEEEEDNKSSGTAVTLRDCV